ncbi:PA14 domain-containing protein [Bacillus mycoides]|uniref:PA14 domain-containing protein n=1 Tax=Bacillus mycoides TaxID=1405 RepID=UPI003803B1C5
MPIETPTDSLQQTETEPHAELIGYYFRNEGFKNLSCISESKTGRLTSELEEDVKSVYWHGYIHAEAEGDYRFQTTDNQSAIITVNGERVLDQSNESKKIQLQKGKKYEIDIQYVRKENQAAFQLYWTKNLPRF